MKKSLSVSIALLFMLSVFGAVFAKKSPECKACKDDLKSCVADVRKKPAKGKKAKQARKAAVKACMVAAKSCKTTCTQPAEEPPPAEENACAASCNADFDACSAGAAPDSELGVFCAEMKTECLATCQ